MNLKNSKETSFQSGYATIALLIIMMVSLCGQFGDSMTPRKEYITPPETQRQLGTLLV
jgi:hypothetical protein